MVLLIIFIMGTIMLNRGFIIIYTVLYMLWWFAVGAPNMEAEWDRKAQIRDQCWHLNKPKSMYQYHTCLDRLGYNKD